MSIDGNEAISFVGGARTDQYCIQDAEWLENPERLIWQSALLSQLKAKHNAVTYFLNDPSAIDFTGKLSTRIERPSPAGPPTRDGTARRRPSGDVRATPAGS